MLSCIVILAGCGDQKRSFPSDPAGRTSPLPPSNTSDVQLLTFALSAVLEQPALREGIREDLRDSPFSQHRIEFSSYLRGPRGAQIRSELAGVLSSGGRDLVAIVKGLPALELVMPKSLDRVEWKGGADLQLMGTLLSRQEQIRAGRSRQNGYKVGGVPHTFVPDQYSPIKLLVIRPVSDPFPADPEGIRSAAPTQDRRAVGNVAEERAAQHALGTKLAGLQPRMNIPPCYPDCPEPPPSPPGVGNGGATLPSQMTQNYCDGLYPTFQPGEDRDSDGVRDNCEFAIASALAPLLNLSTQDAMSIHNPYWAVSRKPGAYRHYQIFYAISYYEDPGDGQWGSEWHHGDSEFIILEVRNSGGSKWGVYYATLSAHWQAGSYDATATYYYDDLEYTGTAPYPRIWASIHKHANYRSKEVCGWGPNGIYHWDSCEGAYQGVRIRVDSDRNLGNFFNRPLSQRNPNTRLIDHTWSSVGGRLGEEHYWSDSAAFAGWNIPKAPHATPYTKMFEFYSF
jgi:hypothetical protein